MRVSITLLVLVFCGIQYGVAQKHLNDSIKGLEKMEIEGVVEYVFKKKEKGDNDVRLTDVKIGFNGRKIDFYDNSKHNFHFVAENKHLIKDLPNYEEYLYHWKLRDKTKMIADSSYMYTSLNKGGFVYYYSDCFYQDKSNGEIIVVFNLKAEGVLYSGMKSDYFVLITPLEMKKVKKCKLTRKGVRKLKIGFLREFYTE